MKPFNSIRTVAAALLLLLFSFSITPRSVLHTIFAQHQDEFGFINKDGKATLATAHINCQCETMVVVSPFTLPALLQVKAPAFFFENIRTSFPEAAHTPEHPLAGLRGPPVWS